MREERARTATAEPGQPLVTLTHVIYGLHAVSLVTGIIGAATVVGAFLTGWPSIIAVILNYVKRSEARQTWLESHFRWQIRTFWFSVMWGVIGGITTIIGIGFVIMGVAGIWAIYRIVKGMLNFYDSKPMYA